MKAGSEGSNFQADLLNIAHTVSPRKTKFSTITCAEERISMGQPRSYHKGAVPQRSPILGTQNDQIRHGNSCGEGHVVRRSATPFFCTNVWRCLSATAECLVV